MNLISAEEARQKARQIIGRVRIIADDVPTRAFVRVTIDSREGYVPVEDAL